MKEIKLTQGQVALVDDEDFERLNQYKWNACWKPNPRTFYAQRMTERVDGSRKAPVQMQHFILEAPPGMTIDHRNRNGLDNRKSNLRICTRSQNQANRRTQSNNKSGFRGVSWHKQRSRWQARISTPDGYRHLGLFDDPKEAANAYDQVAKNLWGEFAVLNLQEAS